MRHHGNLINSKGPHTVIDCKACGFAHIYPLPSKKRIKEFYRREFYEKAKPTYLSKTEKELDYWRITFNDRLEIFTKYIKTNRKKRILDIGCSGGYLLAYFRKMGWDALGIEPSKKVADYAKAKGIDVINMPFEDTDTDTMGRFDAINMAFVLEHTLNPIEICKRCYLLLRKGGIVCVEVPNDFNPFQMVVKGVLKKPSYWIAYPDHINYFNHMSLEKMMRRIGFKLLLEEGTFPMELFILMGDDYIENDRIGLRSHKKRMRFEKILYNSGFNNLKRSLYRSLAQHGIGRGIIQYFVK